MTQMVAPDMIPILVSAVLILLSAPIIALVGDWLEQEHRRRTEEESPA